MAPLQFVAPTPGAALNSTWCTLEQVREAWPCFSSHQRHRGPPIFSLFPSSPPTKTGIVGDPVAPSPLNTSSRAECAAACAANRNCGRWQWMYGTGACWLKPANATLVAGGSASGVAPCRAAMSIVGWSLRHAEQAGAALVNSAAADVCVDMHGLFAGAGALNVTTVSLSAGRRLGDQTVLPKDFTTTTATQEAAACVPLPSFSVTSIVSGGA